MLPGNMPAANTTVIVAPPALVAKSWAINDLDESVTRVLATTSPTPNAEAFTYSMWLKPTAFHHAGAFGGCTLFSVIDVVGDTSHYTACELLGDSPCNRIGMRQDDPNAWSHGEFLNTNQALNVWRHYVLTFDNSRGSSSRVGLWQDGALIDEDGGGVSSGEDHRLFQNGFVHHIGDFFPVGSGLNGAKRLAFVDVVEGSWQTPSAFGFDNAGTWTRKPYVGARGNYGFSIDGTDGLNDVSGNGQHFTGLNMDASNFSSVDLPPFVMV